MVSYAEARYKPAVNAHRLWGAVPQSDGSTSFRIWAPALESLVVEIADGDSDGDNVRSIPMQQTPQGFFAANVDGCRDGAWYRFRLPTGELRPDPASRFQPEGVHGWSQVVDPETYEWNDQEWAGVAKADLIVYELHVGCFTEKGTFNAAIDRLDELVDLGVTAVELMPIAESPGRWNWGYDGVGFFAPRHTFGTPDDLRRLVNAAHQRGLAVLLDVVYNHFGPEGNYWGEFGPYLSKDHSTPWGSAPNFDGEGSELVRAFVIANAAYWIDEYHFDGLRVDAVHCMADDRDPHIVTEIGDAFTVLKEDAGRELHLIAESNVYDPQILQSIETGGHGWDALWCDDFLHSVFAVLRPGDQMSPRWYHPHTDLDAALRRGFVYHGTLREPRRRYELAKTEGSPLAALDGLIYAIQNHDFIGNHPQGRRLHQLTSADAQKAAAALVLLLPTVPMIFMGEEFASESPFYFFVDFGDEHLREAVEQGRRREHPQHDWTDVESPLSPGAFERSKIGPADEGDASMREWYQSLIALRRQWKSEEFMSPENMTAHWDQEGCFAHVAYRDGGDERFVVVRLHPAGEFPRRLQLTGVDDLILENHCESDADADGRTWLLGNHAVAVGRGSIELSMT